MVSDSVASDAFLSHSHQHTETVETLSNTKPPDAGWRVNNWGRLGRWAFHVCKDPQTLGGQIAALIGSGTGI